MSGARSLLYRGTVRRRVIALVTALSLATAPQLAVAQWSLDAYSERVGAGEAAFDAGEYARAVEHYNQGFAMLERALAEGDIPSRSRAQARDELALLDYKIAVALQRAGECEAAVASFERQLAADTVLEVLAPALPVRLAEAGSCVVEQALEADALDAATVALERAEANLARHPVGSPQGALGAEASAASTALDTARDTLVARRTAAIRDDLAADRCLEADAGFLALESLTQDAAALEALRTEIAGTCSAEPLSVHDWAPWVVVGAGGVLLIAGLAVEGGFASDLDDFHSARSACRRGDYGACDRALTLHDDLSSRQAVPATLMITGALAIGGGVTWWLLTHTFADNDAAQGEGGLTPSIALGPQGAEVGLGWRWH